MGYPGGPGQLAQFVSIWMRDHGNMDVMGGAVAKELLQPYLPLGRIHDVDAPDNLGNAFQSIVHDNGKLVCDQPVATPDDEVAGLTFKTLGLPSLQRIDEGDGLVVRAKSNRGLFGGAPTTAGAGVDRTQWPARGAGQVLAGAPAGVGKTTIEQGLQGEIMRRSTLALVNDVAVPFEAISL